MIDSFTTVVLFNNQRDSLIHLCCQKLFPYPWLVNIQYINYQYIPLIYSYKQNYILFYDK